MQVDVVPGGLSTSTSIELNGFRVTLSSPTFLARVTEMSEPGDLRTLRDRYGGTWFLYWLDGKLFALPRPGTSHSSHNGQAVELVCADHLRVLAARIADCLPGIFQSYAPYRQRPFTFLGQKEELVGTIRQRLGLPALLATFAIRPKYELEAKLVEPRDGEAFVGLFLRIGMRWEIKAPLDVLSRARVDLSGLYVVRRDPEPDQRRLVGRIDHLDGSDVVLAEALDGTGRVPLDTVWLEGSRASFARCLKAILGARYQDFEDERAREEERFYTAEAVDRHLATMGAYLQKASPLQLTPDLSCTVGDRIVVANTPDYTSVYAASAVNYCFDPARTKQTSLPWQGLDKYGPFSRETFPKRSPHILVIFPDSIQGQVEGFLKSFRDGFRAPSGRSAYAGGFTRTFGLVNPVFVLRKVPWLGRAYSDPVAAYRAVVEDALAEGNVGFDAALVLLLDEHADLPDAANPYVHTTALLLTAGIPVQHARLSTLSARPRALQYICQNMAIALYAKMGGTPWTVDQDSTISDELVIGMGTAELSGSRFTARQRFVGLTTVFRGDGNYLLSHVSKECRFEDYPDLLKSTSISILREVKERNGWRPGDTVRIVFHAFKPLRNTEIAEIVSECVREVGQEQNIEFAFLTIAEDHSFAIMDRQQGGVPDVRGAMKGKLVPGRGTIVQIGRFTRLVSTDGPGLMRDARSPLPAPLLVHLHQQSTYRDLTYLSEQVLKFTSLSWRSTRPAPMPVTIFYSELIARMLARLRVVPDWSPLMLNIKLRASRWFL